MRWPPVGRGSVCCFVRKLLSRGVTGACHFCRIHRITHVTPAIAAGVTTKLWEMDVVRMIEEYERGDTAIEERHMVVM